jgi:hypothetical protein
MPLSKKYQVLVEALAEYVSEIMIFRSIDSEPGIKSAYDEHLAIAAYLFVLALKGDRLRFQTWVDNERESWGNFPFAGMKAIDAKQSWEHFYEKTLEWRKKYRQSGSSSAEKTKKKNSGFIGSPWPLIERRRSTGEEK